MCSMSKKHISDKENPFYNITKFLYFSLPFVFLTPTPFSGNGATRFFVKGNFFFGNGNTISTLHCDAKDQ